MDDVVSLIIIPSLTEPQDTGWMDDMVPLTLFEFSQLFFLALGNTLVAAVVIPWVIVPLVPLLITFVFIRCLGSSCLWTQGTSGNVRSYAQQPSIPFHGIWQAIYLFTRL